MNILSSLDDESRRRKLLELMRNATVQPAVQPAETDRQIPPIRPRTLRGPQDIFGNLERNDDGGQPPKINISPEILSRSNPSTRTALDNIPGFAGGNLQEQLNRSQLPPELIPRLTRERGNPMDDRSWVADANAGETIRPRLVFPDARQVSQQGPPPLTPSGQLPTISLANLRLPDRVDASEPVPPPPQLPPLRREIQPPPTGGEPFGSSGKPFTLTRERRTQPRDYLADDQAYLEGLQRGGKPIEPLVRKPGKLETVLGIAANTLAYGVPGGVGYAVERFSPGAQQDAEIEATKGRIGQELLVRKNQNDLLNDESTRRYQGAQTDYLRQRPDIEANKLAQRQTDQQRSTLARLYNDLPEFDPAAPANTSLVQAMGAAGLPVVPKTRGKRIQFVQDAQTGQWTVIGADTGSGAPSSSTVPTGTGQPLTTTPPVQVLTRSRKVIADADRASREKNAAANRAAAQNRNARGPRGTQSGGITPARRTAAAKAITELENLRVDATNGEESKRATALQKMRNKAEEIRAAYGDVVEVGDVDKWPYAKMKPETQKQYKLTEQRVREYAKEKNLDPEVMVQRARAAGDIP